MKPVLVVLWIVSVALALWAGRQTVPAPGPVVPVQLTRVDSLRTALDERDSSKRS